MQLLNHTKKTAKSILKISDCEIKNNAKEKEYLESYNWFSIGNIFQSPGDDLEYEFDVMTSKSGNFAVIQYINEECHCVWAANNISDLNSALYHEINLPHYVTIN